MDDELKRVIDKYQGITFSDLPAAQQEEYIGGIAKRGAIEALKSLGLDDEYAMSDIRDLRDLLKAFRVAKKGMFTTFFSAVGRVIGWMFVLWFGVHLMHFNSEDVKKVLDIGK